MLVADGTLAFKLRRKKTQLAVLTICLFPLLTRDRDASDLLHE